VFLEEAPDIRDRLARELSAAAPGVLDEYPVARYIQHLDRYPPIACYTYVSPQVRDLCHQVLQRVGPATLEAYHRLVLCTLVNRTQEQLLTTRLPSHVQGLYRDDFERILHDAREYARPKGVYLYPRFCKELAICTLRLVPTGVAKMHLHGLAKPRLAHIALRQPASTISLLLRLGKTRPLYEMHIDSRDRQAMRRFNPDGWKDTYRTAASMLELHPEVGGLFGSAWFFDPQMAVISPQLRYLAEFPLMHGAYRFRLGPCDEHATRDATRWAPERLQAYQQKKYAPTEYLMVWTAKKLLAWARSDQATRTPDSGTSVAC
jgi:hypothetical protein